MMAVRHIRLVHWNEPGAEDKAAVLSRAGFVVEYKPLTGAYLWETRDNPPDAVVIADS